MRNLSSLARASIYDGTEGEQVWLMLLTLSHPTLNEPYRFVANTENINSNGFDFMAYPFDVVLATDDGSSLPEVQLSIDNIDRTLVETIRTLADPPTINIQVVLASQPDLVEIEISNMVLRNVMYTAYTITGVLYAADILNSRFPEGVVSKATGYLGQFK